MNRIPVGQAAPRTISTMLPPDDPVDSLLERMRAATPALPGSVRSEVWRRIADADGRPAKTGFANRIELAFARPAFAVAFVVACVLGGLLLAEMRASRVWARQSAQVEMQYLRLVDPLIDKSSPRPPPSLSR